METASIASTLTHPTPKQLTNNKTQNLSSGSEKGIEDETPSRDDDKPYIEDFYEDEGVDMDYSQTHLEDFLKSQSNRGVTSQQLLNSFVSTYNKTKKEKKVLTAV